MINVSLITHSFSWIGLCIAWNEPSLFFTSFAKELVPKIN
jgi:hypothetical protein